MGKIEGDNNGCVNIDFVFLLHLIGMMGVPPLLRKITVTENVLGFPHILSPLKCYFKNCEKL